MAMTYGYAGEFSSDEDVDKMEQQADRLAQSKYDAYAQAKPTKQQIEEIIATIRGLPLDQDVAITDEQLAGLLDYFKTARGPIVDSTRVLYKKIVLRLVRNDQHQVATNGDKKDDININNNVLSRPKQPTNDVPSSDEDEPMPPASSQSSTDQARRKFDHRVAYSDRVEPMEVDSEVLTGQIRHPRQVDISSSESDSETQESSDESSESEVLDVTPIKPPAQAAQYVHKDTPAPNAVARSLEGAKKPAIASTPKEAAIESKRKPYTRSQRIAANRASSTPKKSESSSGKSDGDISPQAASATTILSRLKLEELTDDNGNIVGKGDEVVLPIKAIHGRKLNYAEKMVLSAMIKKRQQQAQLKNRPKPSDRKRVYKEPEAELTVTQSLVVTHVSRCDRDQR